MAAFYPEERLYPKRGSKEANQLLFSHITSLTVRTAALAPETPNSPEGPKVHPDTRAGLLVYMHKVQDVSFLVHMEPASPHQG